MSGLWSSFGKGLVQQVYSLSDDSAVMISTSEYYTPNGRVINNVGIEPDIIIPIDKEVEDDIQLEAAVDLLLKRDTVNKN
ncbi:S41 family peptidase [Thioalkalivibrio sp.]|uniref:S41 family peptidase n=1 Tax=Thioalkalivibrio sp. TaxID=2093813 RepID=UPI003975F0B8